MQNNAKYNPQDYYKMKSKTQKKDKIMCLYCKINTFAGILILFNTLFILS